MRLQNGRMRRGLDPLIVGPEVVTEIATENLLADAIQKQAVSTRSERFAR